MAIWDGSQIYGKVDPICVELHRIPRKSLCADTLTMASSSLFPEPSTEQGSVLRIHLILCVFRNKAETVSTKLPNFLLSVVVVERAKTTPQVVEAS